jgi:protein-S-isoprenylcysteine O-methyltransferase Ste14
VDPQRLLGTQKPGRARAAHARRAVGGDPNVAADRQHRRVHLLSGHVGGQRFGPSIRLVDILVAVGLGVAMLVVAQNGYAAANITVESGQTLVSTGLYGLVRHPMYSGSVIMMVGVPLALDSYWGLVFVIPALVALALRIRDEEELLQQQLSGYSEYEQQVHYRLVPFVW